MPAWPLAGHSCPCVFSFFKIIYSKHLVAVTDYLIGVPLDIAINVLGILKLTTWLVDKNTHYLFGRSSLLPDDHKNC